jgi:hypothetical protein
MELQVSSTSGFVIGDFIVINSGGDNQEENRLPRTPPLTVELSLSTPLEFAHAAGERVVKVSSGTAPTPTPTALAEGTPTPAALGAAALPTTGSPPGETSEFTWTVIVVGAMLVACSGLAAFRLRWIR